MRFSSTRRGARLARHLAADRLDALGLPYDSVPTRTVELIVGELCANAVRHGCVSGRDFELQIAVLHSVIRIDVSDARHEQYPPTTAELPPAHAESGYGLLLVSTLATRWGTHPRTPIGKTVWAEVDLSPGAPTCASVNR
ncbi:ATP-binding protein [Streptomyces sp. N2-109]|uniref:ATP-binding protein n=1 Tax=Streptomyces gossypii TaxID=2883101 RepID=A0ABT2JZ49_9ACTN|nr:ATP-binding protein [Streptomyces gossypii]MCT2592524.1 ATP-binding protein [Streptomyces gossypii]